MNKKFILIAGILFSVFLIFLIAIGGGTTSNKVVTEEQLNTLVTSVTCEIKDEESVNYELSTLTNDVSFDNTLQNKQYTKITINKENKFNTLGVAFIVKSNEDCSLKISLNKNEEILKTTTINLESGQMGNVNLLLEEYVEILTTDNFTITFEQSPECKFQFDTIIFFFDEV